MGRTIRPTDPPKGDTRTTLVADLEAKPPSGDRDALITLAQEGAFHDFESKIEMPKVTLHKLLRAAGYDDLAAKVVDGRYDDERPTDEQLAQMRIDLRQPKETP